MYFIKKPDNVQTFVNLHICPIMFFCRLYTFFTKFFSILFSRKDHSRKSQYYAVVPAY